MKLKIGQIVEPIENYSQQICEYGDKLEIGQDYKIDYWFPFYGNTLVVLSNGSHVLKQQLK